MPWINTPNGRSILVLAAVMLASMALVVGLQIADLHPVLPVRLALALVVVGAGIWAACGYWRNVDEAGRAAQKWAWFWGGQGGMGLAILPLALIAVGRTPVELSNAKPGVLLFYGAGVMVLAQLVGFFIAWAYWWARRR